MEHLRLSVHIPSLGHNRVLTHCRTPCPNTQHTARMEQVRLEHRLKVASLERQCAELDESLRAVTSHRDALLTLAEQAGVDVGMKCARVEESFLSRSPEPCCAITEIYCQTIIQLLMLLALIPLLAFRLRNLGWGERSWCLVGPSLRS